MGFARRVADLFGRDSWVVRRARPVREWALAAAYSRSGYSMMVNGVPVRVHPRYRALFDPDYDAAVAAYLRERVRPGAVCFSVGANLGVYPLQFAAWSAPDGRVFAFEPNPETAAALAEHVRMNLLADRVEVVERAVADRPGTATFHAAGTDGMSSLGETNPQLTGLTRTVTVTVDSLDEFCRVRGVRPDVLMMDVEGFEIAALAGARDLFTADPPPVAVVELHPSAWPAAGTTRADLERLLAEYRLRAVPLSGQTDPLGEYGHVALTRADQ
jgi:FkbM family methyltransferase